LGENIADNGGIRSSMKAYQKLRARSGPDFKELLPGLEFFSPEKLLYLAFSNVRNSNKKYLPCTFHHQTKFEFEQKIFFYFPF